ncbi:prepilin peptidase [Butyrivibrio sp. YAB3001]|uniref:prepilin peptidase n=1 Tax=Butyrivibrio sp. YAB3001 TaxID=1520812 RepID=UPI0008F66FFA|nr:prepilin peptidase [Butyrivibrio sp. YAB3001]SFC83439.1 leader peptidase (prepilin peptidase) / N-methyltransferase [Butyrivibrio sp. YAB3001]
MDVGDNIIFKILIIIQFLIMIYASIKDMKNKVVSIWVPGLCGMISIIKTILDLLNGDLEPTNIVLSLIPGLLLIIMSFMTSGGIGSGDGIVLLAIGPLFGLEKIYGGVLLAFAFCSLMSIFLLATKRANKQTHLPFIPFITLGMGVILFA